MSTDTDDDDDNNNLTSKPPRLHSTTKLYQQPSKASIQQLTVPQSAEQMERVQMAKVKVREREFPWQHLSSTVENTGFRSTFARNLIGQFKLGEV